MARTEKELEGVTLLGNQNTKYETEYNPGVLETFVNKHPDQDYVVTFDAYEFTALCPRTGQPDMAKIIISYIPEERMVESKSLKLYLFSYRNTGSFHEDCVNQICKDLVKVMQPKYLEVRGIFAPRGGIAIFPFSTYVSPDHPEFKDLETQRRLAVLQSAAERKVTYDA